MELSWFDPDHYLPVESHVRSRVSLVPLVLFKFCFARDWDCLVCLPGSANEGKRFFFLIKDEWTWGGRDSKKRGRMMTGVTEKDGRHWGKGETSVLKPACTLPERMLRERFVGKTPDGADMHGGPSRGSSRPDAGSICVFVWAGGELRHTYRSFYHGLTERQALKAIDWGRSVGVMFQLSFVEEEGEIQVLLPWQLCSHELLLQTSFWVSPGRLKLTSIVFCWDGFDFALQNDWLVWFLLSKD